MCEAMQIAVNSVINWSFFYYWFNGAVHIRCRTMSYNIVWHLHARQFTCKSCRTTPDEIVRCRWVVRCRLVSSDIVRQGIQRYRTMSSALWTPLYYFPRHWPSSSTWQLKWTFKVIQGHVMSRSSIGSIYESLFRFNSNYGSILHPFQDSVLFLGLYPSSV